MHHASSSSENLVAESILLMPEYQALLKKRHRLVWPLISIVVAAYFAFILLVAFVPQWLSQPVADGVISVGLYVGLALILLTFMVTGIYTHFANRDLESLIATIQQKAKNS